MSTPLVILDPTIPQNARELTHGISPIPEGSKILLLLPPFYTPYTPPLGISVLKSYLEQYGYQVKCLDFNVIPHIWVAHHKYFEILQKSEGLTPQHGYTNLWYILQAHMMAHLNGLDSQGCAQLLAKILPVYDLKPEREIINGLTPVIVRLFSDIEQVLIRELDLLSYAVVGTSTYSTSLGPSLYILKRVKELYPGAMAIMGGGVFADDLATGSDNLETLLREYQFVDHILMGEGEALFRELLRGSLRNKRLLTREDLTEPTLNMKDVTIPDYTDFHIPNYLHLCIEGARSCPFQCKFCSETVQWGNYRKKPSGALADQMIHLTEKHGNKTFFMGDSLMNPYIEDLSKSLLERNADILYDGYLRADKIATDRERTRRWAQSGCVRCRLGIESASANVLKAMRKETTPAGISKVIKTLASAGIRVTTLWIVGFPGETEEDFQETLDFIREHHRFIYELDVHYYYYYPYGQIWSRLHKSYPLYAPDVIKYIRFQQWEIEDCDPTRPVKFDRLRRINDLAVELGIPNIHSLEARYRAEERWRLLFPTATEFLEGSLVARRPYEPSDERLPLPPWIEPALAPALTMDQPATLGYVVRVSKRIDEETIRRAARTLIDYNEILRLSLIGQALSAEPLPPDLEARLVSVMEAPSTETPADLAATAFEISRGVSPRAGDSIRIAVANGSESAVIIFAAHRAMADSRSVVLFLEDLFRIYEQLANDKPVILRRPEMSYGEYVRGAAPIEEAPGNPAGLNAERRPRQTASIVIESDLVRRFTPKLQRRSGLSFTEFIFGGLVLSLAEADGRSPLELDVWADARLGRPDLQFTAGPLHKTHRVALDFRKVESSLDALLRAKRQLRDGSARNAGDGAASVLLNLECLTAEPWIGGDEWVPQGFIPGRAFFVSAPVEVIPFVDLGRVSFMFDYAEEETPLVERWRDALENSVASVWERALADIEAWDQRAAQSASLGQTSRGLRYPPRARESMSRDELREKLSVPFDPEETNDAVH
jgi:radical SAM superfamily enzyme YgiQ (UPF0313 family)